MTTTRIAALVAMAAWLAACAVPTATEQKGTTGSKLESRWQPLQSDATGTYEGVNGEGCSGGLKSGTQALGEQLKTQFNTTYGGYSCRANTAQTSQLSIHGVGRALDITASDSLGDEIANYLVQNATTLGIQLIIWNHTLWKVTPSGATSREYTGPNPHTDHVHAEVNSQTAANGPGTVDGTQTGTPTDNGNGGETGSVDNAGPTPTQTPTTTTGNGDDGWGDQDPYADQGYSEYECSTDRDCDPSGSMVCDQGYCSY